MFFTLKSKSPSPTKVIQDIDDVLEAILKLCTDNMELLADEERSSFMDGFSSISNARLAALNLGKNKKSTLVEVLGECEALKLRVQTMCMKRREDEIRRGKRVSPSTPSTTEVRRQSINSSLNTAPPPEGSISDRSSSAVTKADSFNTAATQIRRQSINSSLNTAPPSEGSISNRFSSVATDSFNTAATQIRRQSIESRLEGLAPLSQRPTTNQPHTNTTDGESWHTALGASTPNIASDTTTAQQTISSISTEDRLSASVSNDIDSMVFGPDSNVASPTFNIDSEAATGATHAYPSGSPSRILPQAQQQPAVRVYQSQADRVVKRERVMYFGPGTTAGSPTFNIRSPNASGTMEQVAS